MYKGVWFMKIKYFGQSCFQITDNRGVVIVTDPYDSSLGYDMPDLNADIVTISHDHFDHNYTAGVRGKFELINKTGNFYAKDINIRGILTNHDNVGGRKRGNNIVYTFDAGGTKICHLGDLGHLLTDDQLLKIGGVNVLLIPVGGYFTIDAREASKVVDQIKPDIVIPMHYKTPEVDLPIETVDGFIKAMGGGEMVSSNTIEINEDMFHGDGTVYVLNYK